MEELVQFRNCLVYRQAVQVNLFSRVSQRWCSLSSQLSIVCGFYYSMKFGDYR